MPLEIYAVNRQRFTIEINWKCACRFTQWIASVYFVNLL